MSVWIEYGKHCCCLICNVLCSETIICSFHAVFLYSDQLIELLTIWRSILVNKLVASKLTWWLRMSSAPMLPFKYFKLLGFKPTPWPICLYFMFRYLVLLIWNACSSQSNSKAIACKNIQVLLGGFETKTGEQVYMIKAQFFAGIDYLSTYQKRFKCILLSAVACFSEWWKVHCCWLCTSCEWKNVKI